MGGAGAGRVGVGSDAPPNDSKFAVGPVPGSASGPMPVRRRCLLALREFMKIYSRYF